MAMSEGLRARAGDGVPRERLLDSTSDRACSASSLLLAVAPSCAARRQHRGRLRVSTGDAAGPSLKWNRRGVGGQRVDVAKQLGPSDRRAHLVASLFVLTVVLMFGVLGCATLGVARASGSAALVAPKHLVPGRLAILKISGFPPGSAIRVQVQVAYDPPSNCCASSVYPAIGRPGLSVPSNGALTIRWRVPTTYEQCVDYQCQRQPPPNNTRHYVPGQRVEVSVATDSFATGGPGGAFAFAYTVMVPPPVYGSGCKQDVVFVGARGTDEGATGFGSTVDKAFGPVADKFRKSHRLIRDSLNHSYPGVSARDLLSGNWKKYAAGVGEGTNAVLKTVAAQVARFRQEHCRNALHVMLAGYSAGAWVVGDAYLRMNQTLRSVVVGVALFGDPRNHGNLYWHGLYDSEHPWKEGVHGNVSNSCLFFDPICHADAATTLFRGAACLLRYFPCAHYDYVKPGGAAEKAGRWLAGRVS